jgi:hypothetical protein
MFRRIVVTTLVVSTTEERLKSSLQFVRTTPSPPAPSDVTIRPLRSISPLEFGTAGIHKENVDGDKELLCAWSLNESRDRFFAGPHSGNRS